MAKATFEWEKYSTHLAAVKEEIEMQNSSYIGESEVPHIDLADGVDGYARYIKVINLIIADKEKLANKLLSNNIDAYFLLQAVESIYNFIMLESLWDSNPVEHMVRVNNIIDMCNDLPVKEDEDYFKYDGTPYAPGATKEAALKIVENIAKKLILFINEDMTEEQFREGDADASTGLYYIYKAFAGTLEEYKQEI